jgi:hypothetical protein
MLLLKATIVACVVCAGVGGTALWVSAPVRLQDMLAAMPTMFELHNRAHLENLPVQDVKDPF